MKSGVEWRETFDEWAEDYDPSRDSQGFPFAGYDEVRETVFRQCGAREGLSVLDLGVGTGTLTARLIEAGCRTCGVDLSPRMLEQARERCPDAELVCADLTAEWPSLLDRRYDRILSTYVFHHFDMPFKKELLMKLVEQTLAPSGRILIGDLAFPNAEEEARCLASTEYEHEEDEYFWNVEETEAELGRAGLEVRFARESFCAGVFLITSRPPIPLTTDRTTKERPS